MKGKKANQQIIMQQVKYQKDIESRARNHEEMLVKVKGEIEAIAAKNFDTMEEDVRREAKESINKILLSHDKENKEKSKQSYAQAATKSSFEFPSGRFMSNMREKQ